MTGNKKGFTLVELIVVMAIIAVLAAILVPTMLGFMKNAKITQANSNAKSIYTAFSAVIADYTVDNGTLDANSQSETFRGYNILDDTIGVNLQKSSAPGGLVNMKMSSYLDTIDEDSYGRITVNASGTGVKFALYSLSSIDPMLDQMTKQEQKDSTGAIVGCYPLK